MYGQYTQNNVKDTIERGINNIKIYCKEKQNIENEFYLIKEHDYNNYFDEESEVKIAEL